MEMTKDQIIQHIAENSRRKVAEFSGEFARAKSKDREGILAGMEFHRDLADMCDECLD